MENRQHCCRLVSWQQRRKEYILYKIFIYQHFVKRERTKFYILVPAQSLKLQVVTGSFFIFYFLFYCWLRYGEQTLWFLQILVSATSFCLIIFPNRLNRKSVKLILMKY